jgi:transposase InsO family protein
VTAYRFIDAEKARHTVRMICRVIGVSRAAYYVWRDAQVAPNADADALVRVHIRGVHRASRGTYGSPRMTAALRKQGLRVNHKRVARIMREEGLQGAPRRRFRGSTTRGFLMSCCGARAVRRPCKVAPARRRPTIA